MTKKTLKKIIEREGTNLKKVFRSRKEAIKLTLGIFAVSTCLSYSPTLVGKVIDKIENSSYLVDLRIKQKERIEFLEKVEKTMKNPDNMVGYNGTCSYWDIDGDKKADAYVMNPPLLPRGLGTGPDAIIKIQK